MQLIEEEIKVRQISQAYLKIQQNTEYLTNVFRYSRFKKKLFVKFENQTVDIKGFFKLIVQVTYLLYTCYVKKFNIYLSNEVYCFVRKDQTSDVYVEYIIEMDFDNANENEQEMIKKYFKKYLLDSESRSQMYGEYVIKLIKFYLEKGHNYIAHVKTLKKPIQNENQLMRQIQNLEIVIKHLQMNLKKITSPKAIILCLQETQMFMQNSILLKVMNNSIYSAVRVSKNSMDIFNYLNEIQNKLLGENTKNTIIPKDIQLTIEECFKFLIKENIVSSEQSLNDTKSNNKNYILGEIEGRDDDRKFFCRIKIFEKMFQQFNSKILEEICQQNKVYLGDIKIETSSVNQTMKQQEIKKKIQRSDYVIQFITSKNLLCVKYITEVELNIQNTDVIMFQCNNISFNWNSVSMQLVEKSQSKNVKRKERYIAFKTLAQFSAKEKPLFKILLLIDLVMICAKISQPELKKSTIKLEDYWKIEQIGSKINHVINLFIKKIDKIYKSLNSSGEKKKI